MNISNSSWLDFNPVAQSFTLLDFSKTFFDDAKIFMKKKYGKHKHWGYLEQSRYIESIFLCNVSNSLILKHRVNQSGFWDYIILDGYERIKTLHSFLNNDLCLQNLLHISELNGFNYEYIMRNFPKISNTFSYYQLSIIILPHDTPDEYLKNVYNCKD